MDKKEKQNEKLIQAVLLVGIALILYVTFLQWPEKFSIMLLGFLTIYIFNMLFDALEKKLRIVNHGVYLSSFAAVPEERRRRCVSLN